MRKSKSYLALAMLEKPKTNEIIIRRDTASHTDTIGKKRQIPITFKAKLKVELVKRTREGLHQHKDMVIKEPDIAHYAKDMKVIVTIETGFGITLCKNNQKEN